MTAPLRTALACCLVVIALALPARAQDAADEADARPAFGLSTSQVFTTREAPGFFLTFRRVPQLDIRVYRVRDPFAFFAGLKDPHQLGTWDQQPVPQERSWIERLSDWKRRQRSRLRDVARAQVSHGYRSARRVAQDRAVTAQRVQLNVNTFAQVPLLNPDQLVTSWRELLPNHRDTEFRRVPLAVTEPGAYVVEAVHEELRAYTIVMVSDVGVVTKAAPGQLLLFAANRFTGEPIAGCDVRVVAAQATVAQGVTSSDGLLAVDMPPDAERVVGIARCGDQMAATDPAAWGLQGETRELIGYVYTDKSIYRPGQMVHVKGVLRWRERDALRPFDRAEVELVVSDDNDKVFVRRPLKVDAFGAVAASFAVPATGALGAYRIQLQTGDRSATGSFEVQEYRKPEFEVTLTPAERFVVQGGEAVIAVQARYYFGQPVANGRLHWVMNEVPYESPLRYDESFEATEFDAFYGNDQTQQGDLRLDENGRAELRIPLAAQERGFDYTASIQARVTDASSRDVSGSTNVHATWGRFLLAAQVDRSVYREGATAQVTVRAVDYLGTPRAGVPVTITLERVLYESGYYNPPTITTVSDTSATTDAEGRATGSLTLPGGQRGEYRVVVTAPDGERTVRGHTWLYLLGPRQAGESEDEAEGDRYLELVADRKTYRPGDVARLVVRGETVSGPVLVTKEGQHVSWYRVLRPAAAEAIEVPVESGDVGDTYVNVTFMRDGRLYRAERRLGVPAVERTLTVAVSAEQAVSRPQEPGVFTVQVTDQAGQPVRAQVSLAVVDEAVFAVRPDTTTDPTRFFYRRDYSRVATSFSREYHFSGMSGRERLQLAGRKRRPFTLADFKGEQSPQPAVRKDFPDAIYWIPDLLTDAEGRARVAVKYPDALTTWRLTARAVTEDTRVGATVARTTTTKDLIVRVITPRFLTEGDEVVMPTIVHNYRDQARTASVDVRVSGLEAAGGAATTATGIALASGAERRDDWRFVSRAPGTATITASARTESDTDAVELPVPVLPFGLRRDTGVSGSLPGSGEATADLPVPATANPAGRTVRVSLAPSLAGSLLGAMDFLTSYPYGCTEQTLSSFLPNLLVTRALTELKLAPTERLGALDRQVSSGVRKLFDMQHADGGWGWWRSDGNHPFMTAYALWGLDEARRAGAKVTDYRLENAAQSLARMYLTYPRAEPDLKVYMAYTLRRAMRDGDQIVSYGEGEPLTYRHDTAREDVWSARTRMSAYGRAVLLLLLDEAGDSRGDELAAALLSEARTQGDLSWWTVTRDDLLMDEEDTSVEATAFAVQALVRRDPRNPLLERAVRWLLASRTGGYWGSTKRTAMALYGLLGFMQARGDAAEPFGVDVFVNGERAGQHTFTAAELTASDPVTLTVPARAGANQVRVVKRGGGTLYWSAAAIYFDPASAEARRGSRQLAISRRYTKLVPVTVPARSPSPREPRGRIVYREQSFDGTAQPGDVLAVRLTVAGTPDWRYLAIEDPLPAGVEALPDTSAYPLERPDAVEWWWGGRFEYSNVEYRDNRTVFFQEGLSRGRYEFVYLVKVISAGSFRAVPAQVSPMYAPGVFAVSEPQAFTIPVTAETPR